MTPEEAAALRQENEQLRIAFASRIVIEQALEPMHFGAGPALDHLHALTSAR